MLKPRRCLNPGIYGSSSKPEAKSQDKIGWRWLWKEGMISTQIVSIYADHASQLLWLLEVSHGQWIYQDIQVHDEACGGTLVCTQENE